jgi:hypothetical protein
MVREIPEGSVLIQTGLYLYEYTKVIAGNTYTFRQIYSAEGYCFYDITNPENLDEEGNLLPPEQRMYAQYMSCAYTREEIDAYIVSVPVEDGYEIVSAPANPPVTA